MILISMIWRFFCPHSLTLSHTHSQSHSHSISLSLSQICSFHGQQCEIISGSIGSIGSIGSTSSIGSSYLFEAKTNGLNLNFKMLLWNLFFEASKMICFRKMHLSVLLKIHLSTGSEPIRALLGIGASSI